MISFDELNLYVYHSIRGLFFDAVIWCLGPLVDDDQEYGLLRCYLAAATRWACRSWLARHDAMGS